MLRQIRTVGIAAVVALAVAVFAIGSQDNAQNKKKDIRMLKGNMPGGVTLYGTDEVVPLTKGREIATFAAGCFWGIEDYFRQLEGVTATAVGFSGGTVKNPTYKQVCYTPTGHAESVRVEYDPKKISYEKLLETFWRIHDPCQVGGQGPDYGDQYRSVIFYHNEKQKEIATRALLSEQKSRSKQITTKIVPEATFWMAEEYHQQYCLKNGIAACPIPGSKGGGH